jgi:hypothetical protein
LKGFAERGSKGKVTNTPKDGKIAPTLRGQEAEAQ